MYLIEILHQTTTWNAKVWKMAMLYLIEILHQTTTSYCRIIDTNKLYLIEILHQTTTCRRMMILLFFVVSYWNSTSNHNDPFEVPRSVPLYLIEILHQTTTVFMLDFFLLCCILLKFYIKPQQTWMTIVGSVGCILLKFYIKPQHDCAYSIAR